MKELSQENNFLYLCLSLIVLLFAASLVQVSYGTWGEDFFSFITLVMIIASIKSLYTNLKWRKILYALIVLFILVSGIAKLFSIPFMPYVSLTILLNFRT